MEIIQHYACMKNDELMDFLRRHQVPFREDGRDAGVWRVYFDVRESDPCFPELADLKLDGCVITKRVKYSKKEMDSAQWLTCTPTTAKVNLTNQNITFSLSGEYDTGKAYHRRLSGLPFYVLRPISHSANQHFFASHEATNQLFCTEYARSVIQGIRLPVSFDSVLSSRTELPVGDLYAVRIHPVLPVDALDLENSEKTFICPCCGAHTFLPPLPLNVRKEYLRDVPGVCCTEAIFGWGGNYTAPITLISKEVYAVLAANHLLRGLEIEPVSLI